MAGYVIGSMFVFLLGCKIFGQNAELFLKTFGEIGRCVESYQIADFVYFEGPLHEVLRSSPQPDLFDEVVGRHPEEVFHFDIQYGTAHVDHLCKILDRKLRIRKIALDYFIDLIQKDLVGGCL